MHTALRALRSRNYRLYFSGQLVSMAGTWVQQIAMIWLAYRLSNSAFVLGLVGFATQIPVLLFASFGGVWTDRVDRRRLLMATQVAAMGQALLLAGLAWTGSLTPHVLIALAFVLGCINALDVPARQAIAVQLIDRPEDLPNAIALNALVMNASRFVGPALGGFLVAMLGEALCFFLNALSYLAVLVALRAIRLPDSPKGEPVSALRALREGFRYALAHPQIRGSLILVAGVSFLAAPYVVLMPLFASEVFGGDARTYGLLVGSAGFGSLLASAFLATRSDTSGLRGLVTVAAPVVGIALALFAFTSLRWLAFVELAVLGFAIIAVFAGSNTLIQLQVEDAFRGRVMSMYSMAFLGVAPLGSLTVGTVASMAGIRPTLAVCGLLIFAGALYCRSRVRSRSESPANRP